MSRRPSVSHAPVVASPFTSHPNARKAVGAATAAPIDAAVDAHATAGVGDRRARGEAGMSVLKWRLAALSGKTRDRDRAAKADRDDIELLTDEADGVPAAGSTADKRAGSSAGRRDAAARPVTAARADKRRLGMREKLGLSQVQRGKEIRRAELRRKKSRKHSDDEAADDKRGSGAAGDEAAGDATGAAEGRMTRAADGEQRTTRGRREEESKQQLSSAPHGTSGGGGAAAGGDFMSALQHGGHEGRAEVHEEAEEERRRRKERHEGQSLRIALEGHGSGSSSGAAERVGKRSGHGSTTRPLTLSQQLVRVHRGSDGPSHARHTALAHTGAHSTATSRPHTPPASSATAPPGAQFLDQLCYSLASPPPASLPFLAALSNSLHFFRPSSLTRRWSHFHSLCRSPPCVALLRALYFVTAVDNFQNDGHSMRDELLRDINRHFTRLTQLLDITLSLPPTAHTDDDDSGDTNALYAHLLTALPEDVIVSSATPSSRRPTHAAVKTRLLTALPLVLSSAVFSLLYSLFPLSRHLLTLSFLHRVDSSLLSLTCGFDMADSTVARQRAAHFEERPVEQFSLSGLPSPHVTDDRRVRHSGREAVSAAAHSSGSAGSAGGLFGRGDWAQDEKERREQLERKKALTSPHTPTPSALSPDFIRTDPTLSPYQRVLLLDLLTQPGGSRQQLLNANSLSPLLKVGLQRCTPDSSWRLEHKLRYVVPAQSSSHTAQRHSGADKQSARGGGGIEEEAERWVRKLRGEGSRRSRYKGATGASHDESSAAARAGVATGAAAAQSASGASVQRERLVEGDPLAVLTPRTRKLVLRYSTKDDDDDTPAQPPNRDGATVAPLQSPALVSSNAKGSAGAQSAEDVLSIDLAADGGGTDAAKSTRNQTSTTAARKTARQSVADAS